MDKAAGIDFSRIPGTKMASSRAARTALTSLGRRAHVVPGAANTIADLMARYLLPRRLFVRMYAGFIGRALTGDTRNVQ